MNAAICLQRLGYIRGAEEIMQSAKGCTAERRHQIIKDNLDALQVRKKCRARSLGLRPANERRRYKVTPSLIGWAET